ncbi:hypothetical protein BJ912DRAFT_1143870 [Pholiota molesta]|nr:hypothetical protein BJ912DRAFT_1143870 [Pholiota molesta]
MESSWNCILGMLLAHANPAQTLTAARSGERSQKVQLVRPLRSFYIELPVWEDPAVFQCTIEDGIEVTRAAGFDYVSVVDFMHYARSAPSFDFYPSQDFKAAISVIRDHFRTFIDDSDMSEHILCCPQVTKGQSCPPCDELAALNQEISEAEGFLATLNAKRPSIYGRMNHAHDPLTSKLPVEMVSKIFTYFLPDNVAEDYGLCTLHYLGSGSRRTTPFLLGAVCVAWRAITWSTPELWSSISFDVTNLNENHADIVRGWLRRSGGCPLYIKVYTTPGYTANKALEAEVLDLFRQCSDRWFYLVLDVPLKFLPPIDFTHAVMLNTLSIKTGLMDSKGMTLGMNPGLRKLYMDFYQIGILANVDWNKLNHLETQFISINSCVDTFSKASFLRFCALRIFDIFDSAEDDDDIGKTQNAILQHNHLLFLHILDWTPNMETFLPMVQFPALQDLFVSTLTLASCNINLVVIADLLRRSHCSLKRLSINVTSRELENELELVQLLAQIPSLEALELKRNDLYFRRISTGTHFTSSDSVDHLLTALSTTALTQGTEPNQLSFLPNLEILIIKNMELSWNCVLELLLAHSNKGSSLETSQNVRPLRSVYLELRGQNYMHIEMDTGKRLEQAIEDSFVIFDFKILESVW